LTATARAINRLDDGESLDIVTQWAARDYWNV
jgi:hypothetical protein